MTGRARAHVAPVLGVVQEGLRVAAPRVFAVEDEQPAEVVVARVLQVAAADRLAARAGGGDATHHR